MKKPCSNDVFSVHFVDMDWWMHYISKTVGHVSEQPNSLDV